VSRVCRAGRAIGGPHPGRLGADRLSWLRPATAEETVDAGVERDSRLTALDPGLRSDAWGALDVYGYADVDPVSYAGGDDAEVLE